MEQPVEEIEKIKHIEEEALSNLTPGADSFCIAVQTERIFAWLRQSTEQNKNLKAAVVVSKNRVFAITKHPIKSLTNRTFSDGKNKYFRKRYFIPLFLTSSATPVWMLSTFFVLGKESFRGFAFYTIIALTASFLFAALTTLVFQKHQENEIEQFSHLDEIHREQDAAFRLKAAFDPAALNRALIHLKKDLDSLIYLLPTASILLSGSVLFIAYGTFADSFWQPEAKGLLAQKTISEVAAGLIFLSGAFVIVVEYVRLKRLREWQAWLELSLN